MQKSLLNTEVGCNDDNARRDDIISTKAVCVYDGQYFFPYLHCGLIDSPHPPTVDIPISIELFKKKQGSQINTE